jgi:hypothetical protein
MRLADWKSWLLDCWILGRCGSGRELRVMAEVTSDGILLSRSYSCPLAYAEVSKSSYSLPMH